MTGAGTLYLVQVTKVPAEEMFVEKRLVLTADFTGRVLAVSAPQSTLFGFPGSELLGSCLADSVDLFADWRERSGEGQMQMLLLALLDKEQEMPGTSWRVRVHAPPSAHEGELPPLPGHVRTAKAKLSCSACLQVELDEDGDGGAIADSSTMGALGDDSNNQTSSTEESVVVPSGPSPPSTSGGSRLHITLWRRDLLSGVLELDEDLVVRRASPLAGLITGLPTSALLRKPLSRFLDLPPRAPTWDALVAVAHPHTHAHQHQHVHKKSALKATSDRGSISPVMAFIGPHPDSGTMRLIVQGVQTLGPGGRPKVALTVHPDTLYVGAHANLMRVLRLEGGADDSHRHRRSTDGATSVMCGRSTRAVSPMGVVAVKSKGLRVAEGASGDGDGVGEGTGAGGGAEGEGDANDGDNDAEEAGDDAEPHVSLHRQATSKSEFVEQWVRSLTSQMSGAGANAGRHHHGHHHAHPHQDSGIPQPAPQSRPGSGAHTDSAATAAAPVPAAEPARPDCGRSDGLDGMFALPMSLPQAGASSQLAAIPEAFALPDVDGIAAAGGVKGKRADAEQARRTVSGATVAIDGLVTKLPSRDIVEPPADGRDGNGKVPSGGRKGAEDDDDKSDLASENDASSVGDGSQAASAYSGTSDQTSVTEVVVDARRGRLLRALNKLLLGPSLMTHLNRLRLASYLIIAIMFLAHVISYIAITGLVKKQHGNVNIVYQQARAMDRSQLIVVRILSGTFCETNGVLRVALCANNLNYTIARLVKYINSMESYHQGVYLGLDTSRVTPLAPEVYKIWTTPAVDYQVFLDTQTPEVVTQRAGAWSLGNRFLAAARESLYLLPIHKANYTYHRTFSFLVYNGLGPLFTVYADSLDHLVDAAWESVRVLRTDLIILLIVEALLVQACCTACELLLVQRTETARSLGILAIVGLPGPVLRQLATSEIKVSFDSDDEGDGGSSLAGSDDDARMAPAGGARVGGNGTGGMESRRLQLPAAGLPEPGSRSNTDTRAQEMTTPPDSRMPTAEGGGNKAGTGRSAVSGDEDEPGSDSGNTRKGGLACRTFKALQMQGSKRTATRGSANGRKAADGGSGNQRLRINGKVLLPSRWNISKFTVPFLLWNLAVVLVYVITLAKLNGMQAPLASLNMASRVTYRYTRVRALSVALVISPSMRPLVRQLLSAEISTFESEYNALMYGGVPTSMVNGTFRHEVPAGTFASSSFAQAFFRAKGCMRADPTGCFKPGHRYYEVTHNGIDTMVRRMITEMRLLTDDADADATYNSTRTAFMSAVGPNDLYDGLQQGAQLFVDYSINQFNAVTKMHTILLMVSIGLVLGFFLFVLWPHNARLQRDAARQGALLSLVPAEMDVRAHVRGVLKRNGAAGRGRGGRQGGGNTVETS
ncbi:hypothetical protein Agub_g7684 [Astrephomene gubernaculifera]|uniref:PAS domain-containing protein n=1 Tax=Astrephomene gubernaculifera TaxID=47775 RepID=A0AAD3DSE7_9CHLO|nr:hypothetical protein Agub_g7684 [Astrephomene gubernaculifera]